jgi:hypothetical protein
MEIIPADARIAGDECGYCAVPTLPNPPSYEGPSKQKLCTHCHQNPWVKPSESTPSSHPLVSHRRPSAALLAAERYSTSLTMTPRPRPSASP